MDMRLQHAAAQLIEARGLVESAEDAFGCCLRETRIMEDVSQRDLARVVGVNHSHVSRIEHGNNLAVYGDSESTGRHIGPPWRTNGD